MSGTGPDCPKRDGQGHPLIRVSHVPGCLSASNLAPMLLSILGGEGGARGGVARARCVCKTVNFYGLGLVRAGLILGDPMSGVVQLAAVKVHLDRPFQPTNVTTRRIANPDPQNTGPRP